MLMAVYVMCVCVTFVLSIIPSSDYLKVKSFQLFNVTY